MFVSTILEVPGDRLTACVGWTVHDIVAHLAAGSAEIADLIEERLDQQPTRPTRDFEEREARYRSIEHVALVEQMFEQGKRVVAARLRLDELDPPAIEFTGRTMRTAEFATHARSKRAIHRWDIVGRDDVGWALLGQPDLTEHAVKILDDMSTLAEIPANRLGKNAGRVPELEIVLRSDDHLDLVVSSNDNAVTMALMPQIERRITATIEPAARLLALWGRRKPSAPITLDPSADRDLLNRLYGW